MKKVGIIGTGRWGKIIISKLKSMSLLEIQFDRSYRTLKKLPNLDWIFVVTPNESHFDIVRHFLSLGVNIFCEKPLVLNINEAFTLYNLAKKNNCKLYVSDVQNYYENKSFKLKKKKFYKTT